MSVCLYVRVSVCLHFCIQKLSVCLSVLCRCVYIDAFICGSKNMFEHTNVPDWPQVGRRHADSKHIRFDCAVGCMVTFSWAWTSTYVRMVLYSYSPDCKESKHPTEYGCRSTWATWGQMRLRRMEFVRDTHAPKGLTHAHACARKRKHNHKHRHKQPQTQDTHTHGHTHTDTHAHALTAIGLLVLKLRGHAARAGHGGLGFQSLGLRV